MSVVMVTTPDQALKKKKVISKSGISIIKFIYKNNVNQPKFLVSLVSVDVLESYNHAPHFYASHKEP
jgi:hypothetical protein